MSQSNHDSPREVVEEALEQRRPPYKVPCGLSVSGLCIRIPAHFIDIVSIGGIKIPRPRTLFRKFVYLVIVVKGAHKEVLGVH
jgi:hypothetical protein